MKWLLITSIALGFLAVALLVQLGVYYWTARRSGDARRLRRRMASLKQAGPDGETARETLRETRAPSWLSLKLSGTRAWDWLQLQISQQARLRWSIEGVLLRMAGSGAAGAGLFLLLGVLPGGGWLNLLAGLLAGGYLPLWRLRTARRAHLERIEQQLPDTLDFIERAMRAGHAFSSAIQIAGQETPEPLAREFRIVFEQVNFGASLDEALKAMALRLPNPHVNYFVVSVLIQRETGGNLTELLRHVSHAVRERVKFMGQLRVLSSEGRMSGWVLTLLPFGLGGLLYLINPTFLNGLIEDPAGPTILGTTGALMVVGILWMRRIVNIRY